jgi:hypothetical protein
MNLFPESIKIGGINHKVEYSNKFSIGSTSVGFYYTSQHKIKILKSYSDINLSIQRIHETLLHEIIHGIDHIYCGSSIDEENNIVERLSVAFYSVLSTIDLYLKNNNFPKSIFINGINYKIICPYTFEDSINELNSAVNYESSEIYLSNCNSEGIYSPSFIKTEFLWCLLYIIIKDYAIEDDSIKSVDQSFANGLYQVIVDNDLNRLFLEGNKNRK